MKQKEENLNKTTTECISPLLKISEKEFRPPNPPDLPPKSKNLFIFV